MRLPPLTADQWDEAVQSLLDGRSREDAGNFIATLVRHPELTKAYLRFSFYLLYRSTLPPRVRELAILRVAHRRGCAYEWHHHVRLGKDAGLSDDDIAAVRRGESVDEFDTIVLTAVDELEDKSELSDATWSALGERLDERQLMDFVFTVGNYAALAMAMNTFGIEIDSHTGGER